MKTKTLFLAYDRCRYGMEMARASRNNWYGIAIESDFFALVWQRNNRLAEKLRAKILERLEE